MIETLPLCISALSLGVSIATFAWLHLRRVDAAVCTLLSAEPRKLSAAFQFSVANLGTRPLLLLDVRVPVFLQPELTGVSVDEPAIVEGSLPRVIQPGDIYSITIETRWTLTFFTLAAKQAAQRGAVGPDLYFMAKVTAWNPKGKMMIGQKHIATWRNDTTDNSSRHEVSGVSFRLRKAAGQPQFRVPFRREDRHEGPTAPSSNSRPLPT
jgi:hypothetical protein